MTGRAATERDRISSFESMFVDSVQRIPRRSDRKTVTAGRRGAVNIEGLRSGLRKRRQDDGNRKESRQKKMMNHTHEDFTVLRKREERNRSLAREAAGRWKSIRK